MSQRNKHLCDAQESGDGGVPSAPQFAVVELCCYHDIAICRRAAVGMLHGMKTLKEWQKTLGHERNESALKPMNSFWYIDMKFLNECALPLIVLKLHSRIKDLYANPPPLLPTLATTLSFSHTPCLNT